MKIIGFLFKVINNFYWVFLDFFRPRKLKFKNVNFLGLKLLLLLNEDIGWVLYTRKKYEHAEFKLLKEIIQDDYTCVDVGGNIGIYTVFLGAAANNGIIYSFEPQPLYASIIDLNSKLNNLENVSINNIVLSDKEGEIDFSVSEDSAYSSIKPTGRIKEATSIRVKSSTLDSFFFNRKIKVDFLKIDVEGAELLVLKGGEKLLKEESLRPNYLLVELNEINQSAYDIHPSDVIEFLLLLDYECYSILPDATIKGWPHKRASEDSLFVHKSRQFMNASAPIENDL